MSSECTHEETQLKVNKYTTIDYDGYPEEVWEHEEVTVNLCVDIDTHRYQCSNCNKIMYYSNASRMYHERGIKSNICGLDK